MITKPKSSLCDSCCNAGHVTGGSASMSDGKITYDCPQRYCSEFHIAIHFDGRQECEKYIKVGIK